jgi:LPXTG-site transpeptidase (sortase) family protein
MAATEPFSPQGDHNAADVIRDKVERIYSEEPNAGLELAESEEASHRSKHQQFMHELSTSGKDLATIQTEWHNYYQKLPAKEKHQVWQEFYSSQSTITGQPAAPAPHAVAEHKHQAAGTDRAKRKKIRDARSKQEIQKVIKDKVTSGGKLEAKHHLQSLFFGLGMGLIVIVIFMFGFFNEVIIAPFIQPSRAQASTPLIVSSDSVAPTDKPEVIIPKINVEIPVDYGQTTTDESVIEDALESGVVHYPTTSQPGQNGNTAYFGHSSNNIFNKGKYKFAFVLLHTLEPGDTFYLTYNGKVYVYKVFSKRIVDPSEVSVLNPVDGHAATATLITCDPPGTSLHRLIIQGDQISPSPSGNVTATTTAALNTNPNNLPGNGPTLFGRFARSFVGKLIITVILAGSFIWILRRTSQGIGRLIK